MRIYHLPVIMARCLLMTIIIEVILAMILGVRSKKDILNVILVNIMTNPIVVSTTFACNIFYGLQARKILEIILEFLVVVVEGFIYYQYLSIRKVNPFVLALLLNLASFGIGEIYNLIFY